MNRAPQTIEERRAAWLNGLRGQVAVNVSSGLRSSRAATVKAVADIEALVDGNILMLNSKADEVRRSGVMVPLIACKKGCSHCCHFRVTASIPEVLRIADHLRKTLAESEQAEFLQKAKEYVSSFEGLSAYARSVRTAPCVFLDEEGSCGVHAMRPISCRRHHSLDVEACKRGLQDPGNTRLPQITEHAQVIQPIVDGIDLGTRSAGLKPRRVDLVAALILALETDAVERWLNGEDAFAPAEDTELLQLAAQQPR